MINKVTKSHNSKPMLKEEMSVYLGPPPAASSRTVSLSMRANKGANTTPELLVRKEMYRIGIKGYRLNWKNAPGSPDICFPGRKIAIFVNGCYWHRCPKCDLPLPKTNTDFWQRKFIRNIERDKLKTKRLKDAGWKVYTYWECEIKKDPAKIAKKIKKVLQPK